MTVSVLVSPLVERSISAPAFWAFMRIANRGHALREQGYMRCDMAHEAAARALLKSEHTHLLTLDIDHDHPPDIVERLARWVEQDPARLVVGALTFKRVPPYSPLFYLRHGERDYMTPARWEPGLLRVAACGTGAMLIHRSVFEQLPEPWFGYDYSHVVDKDGWPGVDMWFSKLCERHGIAMYCDTTTESPHLTETVVGEAVYRAYNRAQERL